MINIKPLIYEQLSKITGNVTDTYPADWENFPVIIWLEEENSPYEWTDGEEQKSKLRFKVDIFDKVSTSDYAIEVNKIFSSLGLVRSMAQDVPDPSNLRHKVMRFEGIVDLKSPLVYQFRMER